MINHPNRNPNTLFPGHRNGRGEFDYRGPTSGWFSLLHHADNLVDWSDNVMERIQYIISDKPASEQAIRLRHIVFLGDRGIDYWAKLAALDANYAAKYAPLYADYRAKCAPLDADYRAKLAALDAERVPLYADYVAKRDPLYADYAAKCAPLDADHRAKLDALYPDYEAKCAPLDAKIIDYIKPLIDGFAWNGKELVF